jgi:N-acetylneuraminic acid mutarotase
MAAAGFMALPPVTADVDPHGTWVDVGPMPNRRANPVAVRLADGRVLVAGGETRGDAGCKRKTDLFHPASNRWTTADRMHHSRCGASGVLLPNGHVLVVGGIGLARNSYERLRRIGEIYLPHRNRWVRTAPMPVPRTSPIVEVIGPHRVLVTGGSCGGPCTSAFIYRVHRDRWHRTDPMKVSREEGSSVRLRGGNILVAGGPKNDDGLRTAQRYLVKRGEWRPAGHFAGRSRPLLFRTRNGDVQAIPDVGYAGVSPGRVVKRYNPRRNDWSRGGVLPDGRVDRQVVSVEGRAFLIGGFHPEYPYASRSAVLWRPMRREWVKWTRVPQPVMSHAAVKLRDGSVLVLGGQTELEEGTHIPRKLAYRYYP